MILSRAKAFVVAGILACVVCGCSQKAGPPAPLAIDQIVPEFQKAFAQAKPSVKEMADKVIAEVQNKDFPNAYNDSAMIPNLPDATKAQKLLAVRANQAVYQALTTAQAQGDQRSAAAIEMIKKYK